MAGIYSQGGSAGHRYAGWLSEVEAKNFTFGGKVFNGSPSAIYVGSNLVWTYWLKAPAMTAIYGAFGQRDGMAVIIATNAYLNQLAASDMDKATALAGYLNSSPENCLGYINPRYLISQTSSKDLLYVYEHAKAINIAVYGGTSAGVSKMDVTVDGTLVYSKTQDATGFNPVNVANLITTRRVSASADWWRVDAVYYVAYNGTCYTNQQQILHVNRSNTRQEFDMIGLAS